MPRIIAVTVGAGRRSHLLVFNYEHNGLGGSCTLHLTFNTIEMWTKYNIVHPAVAALLSDKLKFHQPTDIQREVFENYKHYYDFLLASQTGSGKTLAFAIPIVSELLNLK